MALHECNHFFPRVSNKNLNTPKMCPLSVEIFVRFIRSCVELVHMALKWSIYLYAEFRGYAMSNWFETYCNVTYMNIHPSIRSMVSKVFHCFVSFLRIWLLHLFSLSLYLSFEKIVGCQAAELISVYHCAAIESTCAARERQFWEIFDFGERYRKNALYRPFSQRVFPIEAHKCYITSWSSVNSSKCFWYFRKLNIDFTMMGVFGMHAIRIACDKQNSINSIDNCFRVKLMHQNDW